MKTVFITGGSSRIGQAIADKLKGNFQLLFLIHHKKAVSVPDARVEMLTGGLSAVLQYMSRIQAADVILHLAGLTHADTEAVYLATNLEGTRQLLSACQKDQRFIYLSTRCAGEEGGAYGYSKLLAERAIQESCLPYTIIRPAEVYGSKASEGIDALLNLARRFRVLMDFRWRPEITYSPISIEEVASFVANAVCNPLRESKVYTLCNDDSYTAQAILVSLRKGLGRPILRFPVPIQGLQILQTLHLPLPFKPDQLARLVMPKANDNSLAKQDYSFSPVSFLDYLETR